MQPKGKPPRKDRLKLIRTLKYLIPGAQIVAVVILSSVLILTAGYSTDPLYVPVNRVLALLLIATAVLSLEMIVLRAVEIKSAPKDAQTFVLVDSSRRGAKRALGLAIILALFFAAPPAQAIVINVLSTFEYQTLDAGESYPIAFNSQDALGITRARELGVAVQSGTLMVIVTDDDRIPNRRETILTAGEQYSLALVVDSMIEYTVTFQNLVGSSTSFTYRVSVGFPPGFNVLLVLLSSVVAVANLAWLAYLKRVGKGMPRPVPKRKRAPSPYRVPQWPGPRPWYRHSTSWQSAYMHRRPVPPRVPSRQAKVTTSREREMPPPPPAVEPYEVEKPAPLPEDPPQDLDRTLIKAVGLDVSALIQKAESRAASGEYQEALEDYETILSTDAGNLRALMGKADLLRLLQRHEEGLELIDRVLQLDPWNFGALLRRGHLLEEQDRPDEALECYDTILDGGPQVVEALIRKGDLLTKREENDLAIEAFREALRLRPNDRELEARVGTLEALLEDPLDVARREAKAGNDEAAEEFYRRALEGDKAAEAREELIDHYFEMGREEESVPLLGQVISESPENHRAILKRARALWHGGRLEDALEDSERASDLAPDDPSIWALRGGLEAELGLESSAIQSLERACSLNPDDSESGRTLKELRKREKERAKLEEVLRSMSDVPEEVVGAILGAFGGIREMKKAKVSALASLEGVSEDVAKRILKRVRKGR